MLKIIGFVLIVGASTSFGFLLCKNLKARLKELKDLQLIIFKIQTSITYTYTPIGEACEMAAKNIESSLFNIFENVSKILQENKVDCIYDAYEDSINKYGKSISLKEEDLDIMSEFFKNIGNYDMDGNKKIFDITNERIVKKLNEAEMDLSKNSKMYKYLGFSFGAVIAILLL